MQFYRALLDETVKMEGENSSIDILICKSKDRTIVEYALRIAAKPIGVATCRIVKEFPPELRAELPNPKEFARLLE